MTFSIFVPTKTPGNRLFRYWFYPVLELISTKNRVIFHNFWMSYSKILELNGINGELLKNRPTQKWMVKIMLPNPKTDDLGVPLFLG